MASGSGNKVKGEQGEESGGATVAIQPHPRESPAKHHRNIALFTEPRWKRKQTTSVKKDGLLMSTMNSLISR